MHEISTLLWVFYHACFGETTYALKNVLQCSQYMYKYLRALSIIIDDYQNCRLLVMALKRTNPIDPKTFVFNKFDCIFSLLNQSLVVESAIK